MPDAYPTPALDLAAPSIDITRQLCDIESVSGNEASIADAIVASLSGLDHLEVTRDGDAIVARTTLGRDKRVVIAGHIDTVPVNHNLPTRFETFDGVDYLWGRGTVDMKAGVAVQLKLAVELVDPTVDITWIWYDHEEVSADLNGLGRLADRHGNRARAEQLRDIGPTLAPHSAFLLAQGVETLPFRMQAHIDNARTVAEWLDADPRVDYVNWAGLPSHPHYERGLKYLPQGPGSVFSFGVTGGRDAGRTFIESVNLASHLANIGDAKTLVIHPASTTHAQLTEQQLAAAGVQPGGVRISVGIEDVEDIIYDLDQALAQAVGGSK
jgi:hypothetical protein